MTDGEPRNGRLSPVTHPPTSRQHCGGYRLLQRLVLRDADADQCCMMQVAGNGDGGQDGHSFHSRENTKQHAGHGRDNTNAGAVAYAGSGEANSC